MTTTIAQRIEAIEKECSGVWAQSGVTDWERQRLAEWKDRTSLAPGQARILQEIERKVFPDRMATTSDRSDVDARRDERAAVMRVVQRHMHSSQFIRCDQAVAEDARSRGTA